MKKFWNTLNVWLKGIGIAILVFFMVSGLVSVIIHSVDATPITAQYSIQYISDNILTIKVNQTEIQDQAAVGSDDILEQGLADVAQTHTITNIVAVDEKWGNGCRTGMLIVFVQT